MAFPPDPYALAKLNKAEAGAYLERIKLSSTQLDSPPSLPLLSTLFLSHLEQIPLDTSPLHVPEAQWIGPSTPIKLGSAFTNMPLGVSSFDRIVHENRARSAFQSTRYLRVSCVTLASPSRNWSDAPSNRWGTTLRRTLMGGSGGH
jgi:hypothetical protein